MKNFHWIFYICFTIGIGLNWADESGSEDVFAEPEPHMPAATLEPQADSIPQVSNVFADPSSPQLSDDPLNSNEKLTKALSETLLKEEHPEIQKANLNSQVSSEDNENTEIEEEEDKDREPLTLADIRPAVKLPHTWVFYTIGSLIGLIITLIFFIRRKCRAIPTPVIELSPYAQALNDLENAQALMHRQDIKPFVIAIADAIRTYFSRGFSLPAPECTTEELLEALKMVKVLSDDIKVLIAEFFQQCDLAKFTKQAAENLESIQLYKQAKNILQTADKALQPPETTQDTEGGSDANLRV